LCALLSSVALAQAPRLDGVRIELRPNPRVVPADGQTASTVRAELRDTENRPVPDGTTIVFRIEGGSLDAGGGQRRSAVTVTTSGGAATVWATSTTVGSATIYAEVVTGGGRNQVQIHFTEEGATAVREARVVHVRGGWVGHAQELGMVEARTGARGPGQVVFGSVRIVADVVQVDTTTLVVKASDAIIQVGDKSIEALDLYYELMSGRGYVRRLGEEGVERLQFDCYTMQETAPEEPIAPEVFRLNQAEALTWAVARSVSIYPYQKIVLRNASIYVDGERLIKLPKYWLIAMPGYAGTTHSQMVSVNSAGELGVDFRGRAAARGLGLRVAGNAGAGQAARVARDGLLARPPEHIPGREHVQVGAWAPAEHARILQSATGFRGFVRSERGLADAQQTPGQVGGQLPPGHGRRRRSRGRTRRRAGGRASGLCGPGFPAPICEQEHHTHALPQQSVRVGYRRRPL
jgi:hypothetical protein